MIWYTSSNVTKITITRKKTNNKHNLQRNKQNTIHTFITFTIIFTYKDENDQYT